MFSPLALLLLNGCPTDAPVEGMPSGGPPGVPGVGGPGGEAGAAPGGEGQPPADGAVPSQTGPTTLTVEPGQGVKISGVIAFDGTPAGTVRIDLIGTDGKVVHVMTLEKLGPWEVEVPKDLGELRVMGFIDADGNGPSEYEPKVEVKVTVAAVELPNVNLTLVPGTGEAPAGGAGSTPPAVDAMGGKPGELKAPAAGGDGSTPPPGGEPPEGAPPAGGEGKAPAGGEGKAAGKAPAGGG